MNLIHRTILISVLALAGLSGAAAAASHTLYQRSATGEGAAPSGVTTPWSLTWLEQKVWASDAGLRDYLGSSFAMSGDIAIGGAPYATGSTGAYQGSAYVFARANGVWSQAQKLVAADAVANGGFGSAVAIEGDTALVGANGASIAAYVFTRGTDGTWTQTQKLSASDSASGSSFGSAVALRGDTALVGANSAAAGGNARQGKVYVFRRGQDGVWSETQQLTADADTGAQSLYFGGSLALQDGTLLVGATGAAVNGLAGYGAVYAFSDTDAGFVQTQQFSIDDGEAHRPFGGAIALSGSRALISANSATVNGNNFAGAAYVFTLTDAGWTQSHKLVASDNAQSLSFGRSVALVGPTAIIGASGATIGSNINQGAAYVFTEAAGEWTQTDKIVASDGAATNYYGWVVAFDGEKVGVSANSASISTNYQGALYFYERSGGDPHTVTPVVAEGQGAFDPGTPQTVDDTATTSFVLTADTGYRLDGVGGNCTGTLQGNVYTTAPITADCSVEAHFALVQQTVTPSVSGGHGTIDPDTPQTVDYGGTLTFTLTADDNYVPATVGGSCGGSLSGTTFTTAPIVADCTVLASFRPATHTVTPSVSGGHGAIDPDTPQTIDDNASATFTLTPDPGYVPTVAGTCGGTLDGNTYTTAPVLDDCTVEVSYSPASYTVTPRLLTSHGVISPGLPQTVGYGAVLTFSVIPDEGYVASVGGSCGGTLSDATFTTAPISASCTVDASFAPLPDTIFKDGFDPP